MAPNEPTPFSHPSRGTGEAPPGSARRAPDLEPREQALAAWFSSLDRPQAPSALRAAVLGDGLEADGRDVAAKDVGARDGGRPSGVRLLSSRLGSRFPLGAWGMATAALVLVALGAVVGVELSTDSPALEGESIHDARVSGISLIVERDPAMALFHGLETFDEVGLAPGEIIPDWGR